MLKQLTIDALLALPDAEQITEDILVRDLGMVTVRALSMDVHRDMRVEALRSGTWDWPRWDALAMVNGTVEPQVTYDQAVKLRKKAVGVAQDILDGIWRVSGLTERGEIRAKAVDDAEASFREGQSEVQDT